MYRYNERSTGIQEGSRIQIFLEAPNIKKEFTNEDMPFSVQLPSNLRNFTIRTSGDGRIVAGVKVLASPRKRSKRDDDSSPSIVIIVNQTKASFSDNYVTQKVCIQTKSTLLKQLEIDHHFYTGFSGDFSKFSIIGSTAKLVGIQRATISGLHFTLGNLSPDSPACYQLILKEPTESYTPSFLAPVTIEAYYNREFYFCFSDTF